MSGNGYGIYSGSFQVTQIDVDGVEPGATMSLSPVSVVWLSGTSEDSVFLSATLATRKTASGSFADGLEPVDERWLEAKIGAGDWTPIGGGPDGDAIEIEATDFVSGACEVQLQIKVPATPSTFGDVTFFLDLFYS